MAELEEIRNSGSWLSLSNWFQWKPTSLRHLAQTEEKIIKCLKNPVDSKYVAIAGGQRSLWTVVVNKQKEDAIPLVLVHGMGGGVGLWAQNLDSLAEHRPVYAFDLLGFGRSSRPKFSSDAASVEVEFVESIEQWRKQMGLEQFILLGHSLGGYIASSYSLKYPDRVKHLVLVDPWGFQEHPQDNERTRNIPVWIKVVAALLKPFNPLVGLRAAGPWGPGLVKRFRPDFRRIFSNMFDDDTIFEYIYHCNAQTPASGESAFKSLTMSFGWAKNPMVRRIGDLHEEIPITMLYGSRSWIDSASGYQVKYLREQSYVDVQIVKSAGHHVYADKPQSFNNALNKVCKAVDLKSHRQRELEYEAMDNTVGPSSEQNDGGRL